MAFTCPMNQCNSSFTAKKSVYRHLRTVHQDKALLCTSPKCTAAFARKDNLDRHYKEQHGDRTELVECVYCGKQVRKRVLGGHMRSAKCRAKQNELAHSDGTIDTRGNSHSSLRDAKSVSLSLVQSSLRVENTLLASTCALFYAKCVELPGLNLGPEHLSQALQLRGTAMRAIALDMEYLNYANGLNTPVVELYLSILSLFYLDGALQDQQAVAYHTKALDALERELGRQGSVSACDPIIYDVIRHSMPSPIEFVPKKSSKLGLELSIQGCGIPYWTFLPNNADMREPYYPLPAEKSSEPLNVIACETAGPRVWLKWQLTHPLSSGLCHSLRTYI